MTTVKLTPQMELVDDELLAQSYDLYYFNELKHRNHLQEKFLTDEFIFYCRSDEGAILEFYLNGELLLKSQNELSFLFLFSQGKQENFVSKS